MHVPAALEQWAAEHNDQLSDDTIAEVRTIAAAIAASPLGERVIEARGDDFKRELEALFTPDRAERAATVVQVVASWADKLPDVAPPATKIVAEDTLPPVAPSADRAKKAAPPTPIVDSPPPSDQTGVATAAATGPRFQTSAPSFPTPDTVRTPVGTPAFLHSDKVDEEDDVRLYGPKRPWKAILGTLVSVALLAGVLFAGWWWFTQREETTDTATSDAVATAVPSDSGDSVEAGSTVEPTAASTPEPEPTPLTPSFWADTTPILNSGTSQITASTYSVSPANRAVLTGHTAAITGVVVSNDGRVWTSGADRRLVDWGADVTLADPDVLNVPSPLTVLERTVDQRIIAGDADGNVTIISLVDAVEPLVIPVHDVAISAAAELTDGRIAVASVDGDVAVFSIDTPETQVTLEHSGEVTAVVALDDGSLATAAVDGQIRIWSADDGVVIDEITAFDAPATALAVLADGRLAVASVDGDLRVMAADSAATEVVVLPGHTGAIRALFEVVLPEGRMALVSGGDDTTVRLWDVETRTQVRVLEGHGDIISGLDALPDGRLVSTSGDGTGRVWDLTVPAERPVIPPHDWNLSALHAWSNDQFVSGGTDGKVVLASTSESSEPLVITQHAAPIVGLSVLQSGDIVSLDANSTLRINQSDGQAAGLVEIQVAPGATALDVRESLGVVTGHADGTVRFHDFAEEVVSVAAHGSGVNDVVALSNGLVVSAGQDKTVRIIDFENPDQLPVFDLHTAAVDVVIELPDGRIASAGSDGIYVFTLEGLTQDYIRLNGQRARTISLVALPGDRLISTGDDGRVRLWDLTRPESEPVTLIDIPGVINPYLIQADNGLFVAGAARGYVVFTPS